MSNLHELNDLRGVLEGMLSGLETIGETGTENNGAEPAAPTPAPAAAPAAAPAPPVAVAPPAQPAGIPATLTLPSGEVVAVTLPENFDVTQNARLQKSGCVSDFFKQGYTPVKKTQNAEDLEAMRTGKVYRPYLQDDTLKITKNKRAAMELLLNKLSDEIDKQITEGAKKAMDKLGIQNVENDSIEAQANKLAAALGITKNEDEPKPGFDAIVSVVEAAGFVNKDTLELAGGQTWDIPGYYKEAVSKEELLPLFSALLEESGQVESPELFSFVQGVSLNADTSADATVTVTPCVIAFNDTDVIGLDGAVIIADTAEAVAKLTADLSPPVVTNRRVRRVIRKSANTKKPAAVAKKYVKVGNYRMVKNSDGRAEIIIALDDIPAEQLSEETVAALVGEPLQMSEPIPVGSTPTITETLDMEPGEDGNTVVTVIADGDESSDGADVLTVVGGKIVSNNKRTSGKRIIRKTNNTAAETPTAEVFAGMENTHVASAQEELTAMLALSKLSTQPLRSLMMSEQLTLNSAPKQPEFDMSIPATFPQLSTEQTQQ